MTAPESIAASESGVARDERPGDELKRLLSAWPLRFTASPECGCYDTALKMNMLGCDWCESPAGMSQILKEMKENAAKKGVPFVEVVARMLVHRAVRIARRKSSNKVN